MKSSLSRTLFLFRSFFPSWKFFDDSGSQPCLRYKLANETVWMPAIEEVPWSLSQIFLNPQGNFVHAVASLVDRLLMDATEIPAEKLSQSASYRLVENFVRTQVIKRAATNAGVRFLFKIEITSPAVEDVLISEEHEV